MAKQPIHSIRFGYIKANIWFHQQNPATPQRDGHPLSKRRERSHTSVPTGTIGSTPAQNFGDTPPIGNCLDYAFDCRSHPHRT